MLLFILYFILDTALVFAMTMKITQLQTELCVSCILLFDVGVRAFMMYECSLLIIQTVAEAHLASCPMGNRGKADRPLQSRKRGLIHPLPNTSSWHSA
jgi:hypothetical protein